MAVFTVDRAKWYRGTDYGSRLLRRDGQRCVLGFVGQQCGLSDSDLLGIGNVGCTPHLELWPMWLFNEGEATKATGINDSQELSDADREAELTELFKEHGDEIRFVD